MILTTKSCGVAIGLIVSGCVLNASSACAAIQLEPGQWQDTETGMENGKPTKPEVTTDCMTPEDTRDPVKALTTMKNQVGQCRTFDVKQSGNTLSFVMQCGDPKQMSFDIAATYTFLDRRHYTGLMKSTVIFAGQKTTSDTKVDSKWIGACKK